MPSDSTISSMYLLTPIAERYPNAQITIGETGDLCSFYAEKGGLMLGFETENYSDHETLERH